MDIVFTRRAQRDLESIHAFIAGSSPARAYAALATIRTAINRLQDFPELGRIGSAPGTRELVVPRLPYIVRYRIAGDRVEIVQIRHSARRT